MNGHKDKRAKRVRRHLHVRQRIVGTAERPRLSVFRSLRHTYAQVIDDMEGRTLVSASTVSPEVKDEVKRGGNKEAARLVGKVVAQKAVEAGITEVAFDRGPYRYHGRVKEVAEGARESGLEF